ncbi:hypothetical protein [Paenibacillus macerans]|uniref:hypothetical protein n=1 Tax=Paenibacillus macerans TaxID=44252 RepID=UPI0020C05EC6|nr:hypothetical protein [Paenibacillus macerans]
MRKADAGFFFKQIAKIIGRHVDIGGNRLQRARLLIIPLNVLLGLDHHIVPLLVQSANKQVYKFTAFFFGSGQQLRDGLNFKDVSGIQGLTGGGCRL